VELTLRLEPESVEFALDFNQFTFDEVTLSLLAIFSESEEMLERSSMRPKLSRAIKKQKLPEPDHKLNKVELGKQQDVAKWSKDCADNVCTIIEGDVNPNLQISSN
jgi:hypothetical protein